MGKIILVASGKGGTGKTTTAANLAAALSLSDKLTVAVDMDMGLRNLDIALGMENNIVYDICDVIDGVCELDEALIKDDTYENLYILSSPQTRKSLDFDDEKFIELWGRLRDRFDYCIIDAPAGIVGGFSYARLLADMVLIVATPDVPSLRDADRVISELIDFGCNDIYLILNRVRPELIEKGIMMNADECVDMLQIPVIGIVGEDTELLKSALRKEVAINNPDAMSGMAFLNISKRILGDTVPIMEFGNEKNGLIKRLKKLFKD